jgi:hypothetical protein
MQDSNEKIKFWAVLIGIMLGVSVAVLLIDMTIKAAILEESNALRRTLLGVRDDGQTEANPYGTNHNGNSSSPVLDFFSAGMEAGNVANGHKETPIPPARKRTTRTKPGTQGDTGEIPSGD